VAVVLRAEGVSAFYADVCACVCVFLIMGAVRIPKDTSVSIMDAYHEEVYIDVCRHVPRGEASVFCWSFCFVARGFFFF